MQDSDQKQKAFTIVRVACEKHHDWWETPGSLLAGHYQYLLDDLPPEAVRREFFIHTAAAVKESV
jgi:hypothetical protein